MKAATTKIAAKNVLADYHAIVLSDGQHPVDDVYWRGNRIVIRASNLTLLRHPTDLVDIVVIGGDTPPGKANDSYLPDVAYITKAAASIFV